jgi:chemotaxis protein MotB
VALKADKKKVIVVKKKKAGHGGHHGGAWKVAYADFVTAMMAFFMVMWILGMDENTRASIEGYFSNPVGFKKGYSTGTSPISVGASPSHAAPASIKLVARRFEERRFDETSERIKDRLKEAGLASIGDRVEIVETTSGLRIELSDGGKGRDFFATASASMSEEMRQTLEIVAQELRPLRNLVVIEGHTDAAQYAGLYSNWELSADRANAARRIMESAGLSSSRVIEVRGMADRQLRNPANPLDPRNRRISIFLPFLSDAEQSDSVGYSTPDRGPGAHGGGTPGTGAASGTGT